MFSVWREEIVCPYCGITFQSYLGESACSACGKPYKVFTRYRTIKLEVSEEDKSKFYRNVKWSLKDHPYEGGMNNPLDEDFELLFQMEESEQKTDILNHLLTSEEFEPYRAEIIHLISRVPATLVSQKAFDLVVGNLVLNHSGITDAIVQCFESWKDKRSYDVLVTIPLNGDWLDEYIQGVTQDLKEELGLS